MHPDGIWNDLELQRSIWKQARSHACILPIFETIWNCREHFKNNVYN